MSNDSVLGPGLGDAAHGPDHTEVDEALAAFYPGVDKMLAAIVNVDTSVEVGKSTIVSVEKIFGHLTTLVVSGNAVRLAELAVAAEVAESGESETLTEETG